MLARSLGRWCRVAVVAGGAAVAVAVAAASLAGPPAVAADAAPYPRSATLTSFRLDWKTQRRLGLGSDIWPVTWTREGTLLSAFGDGGGLGPADAEKIAYVGIGFSEFRGGSAATIAGRNVISGVDPPPHARCFPLLPGEWVDKRLPQPGHTNPCRLKSINAKSVGILALDDKLYAWLMPGSPTATKLTGTWLYRGNVATNAWTRADWGFRTSDAGAIGSPVFLQAGQNHGAIADHVYAYAARWEPFYDPAFRYQPIWLQKSGDGGEIVLMRARKDADLLRRESWSFHAGGASWVPSPAGAKPVFADRNGVGMANNAIYVPQLKRYLLVTHHTAHVKGHFGIFESQRPEGPWSTVFYGVVANSGAGVPPTGFTLAFVPNSFSADGKRFTMALSGRNALDSLNLIDGSFN